MYECVVIGASAGGMRALTTILSQLPEAFGASIAVVQHIDAKGDGYLAEHLRKACALDVKEAESNERICAGDVYLAPADYHLLVERDRSFSLSVDDKVHFARPAIDVLFESAADAYGDALVGIVLTGANADGAEGLKAVKRRGGLAIVQDPQTAEAPQMPMAAIAAGEVDVVIELERIAPLLTELCGGGRLGARAGS